MAKGILWAVIQDQLLVDSLYEEGKPHHITLMFGVDKDEVEQYIGMSFNATAISNCWNEDIQAVLFELPLFVPINKGTPHVTVSYKKGVKSVESNNMLNGEHNSTPHIQSYNFVIEFLEWS
jgi:hypothetical protein